VRRIEIPAGYESHLVPIALYRLMLGKPCTDNVQLVTADAWPELRMACLINIVIPE